jgi:hypothetical protein
MKWMPTNWMYRTLIIRGLHWGLWKVVIKCKVKSKTSNWQSAQDLWPLVKSKKEQLSKKSKFQSRIAAVKFNPINAMDNTKSRLATEWTNKIREHVHKKVLSVKFRTEKVDLMLKILCPINLWSVSSFSSSSFFRSQLFFNQWRLYRIGPILRSTKPDSVITFARRVTASKCSLFLKKRVISDANICPRRFCAQVTYSFSGYTSNRFVCTYQLVD